jgi:hypothetical protein
VTWVKLEDDFSENPKIAGLSDSALALWVTGLAYCNRNLTDGFIPSQVGLGQLRYCDGNAVPPIRELEATGLWDEIPGGWEVHDFHDYQPTKEAVLAERAAARERMQELRKNRKISSKDVQANMEGTSPRSSVSPVPVPDPVPKQSLERDSLEGVGVDVHKELLVTRLLARLGDIDGKALADIRKLSEQLPPSALVKVQESLETRRLDNPVGYALNALRSELREAAVA